MFAFLRKNSPKKRTVDAGLNYIIRHAEDNKEYKGIDQNRLSLISIKKESAQRIVVSVDIETEDSGGEILINKQKIVAHTAEEAIAFFSSFGIGTVSWLK